MQAHTHSAPECYLRRRGQVLTGAEQRLRSTGPKRQVLSSLPSVSAKTHPSQEAPSSSFPTPAARQLCRMVLSLLQIQL